MKNAETKLLDPEKFGGLSLLEALDARASAGKETFPTGDLTQQDWGTLLWATIGLNRDGSKWTVPMGLGRPPYCKVYIATKNGIYQYDWKNHSLIMIADSDQRALISTQDFAKTVPAVMLIVADSEELAKLPSPEPVAAEFAAVLGGAISQNVYLAAQTMDVGVRLVYSVDRDAAAKFLKIAPKDKVLFAILLGKK